MLTLTEVTVSFPGSTAVDGVTLTVPDGCVLALLGPSGCGKSTLLRAIAGLEPLQRGSIAWNGVDLAQIPVHRRGFGLMFQDGVLFPHRNVAQNVAYGLRAAGLRGSAADRRVAELLDLVGLRGFGDRSVTELSGGEAQRVALARALAPRPRLLLLDEPLAALDRALRDSLLADLRGILTETSTPAIFVTHDQQEAFAVADRVALMRAGRLVQTGTPSEVWAAPVDEWVAGFLGYTAVVDGTVVGEMDGICSVRTDLGAIPMDHRTAGMDADADTGSGPVEPGGTVRVALRPSALVVDRGGGVTARCVAVVPGPDRTTLSVQLSPPAEQGETTEQGTTTEQESRARPDGRAGPQVLSAVAEGVEVAVGDAVTLRLDPSATAVIRGG